MTFTQIVDLVASEFGQSGDAYFEGRLMDSAKNRHRMIYESFDWTAAQDTTTIPWNGDPDNPTTTDITVSDAEKILSARFNGDFLDPVSANYIFESHPEMLVTPGKPLYYWSRFDSANRETSVRLFPSPDSTGSLDLLIKKKFDEDAVSPLIPGIDETLIDFVRADAWQVLRQINKYQAKLQEAQALLQAAQQRDTPAAPKPRTSKNLTATGSTLAELTDSVCDIVGRWEPDIRESVKERIRRNYQLLWDTELWPESIIIANCPIGPDQQQIVLPHLFDRVIAIRTNEGGPLTQITPLKNAELSYYFNVAYNIFEQSGEPLSYAMLSSVAVETLPPRNEKLVFTSYDKTFGGGNLQRYPRPETHFLFSAFVKGESSGVEYTENVDLITYSGQPGPVSIKGSNSYGITENTYDTPLTISKPQTDVEMKVFGYTTGQLLLTLPAGERERKHLRVLLEPSLNQLGASDNVSDAGRVLICGKRQVSALIDDNDSPQLRNVANILINGAAADIFDRLGNADMAAKYSQKAGALMQVLINAETKQNAYSPKIVPYTENYRRRGYTKFWS